MYLHNSNLTGRLIAGGLWLAKKLPQETDPRKNDERFAIARVIGKRIASKRVVIKVGDVPCTWYIPDGAPIDRAVLYFHGGAYVAGRPLIDYSASLLASRIKMRVLAVDYSLAPEKPYPAALNDAWNVYMWLRRQGAPDSNIAVLGDSAGGGLAAALTAKIRDEGQLLPSSLTLFSPWLDLRCSSVTYEDFTRDPLLSTSMLHRSSLKYANSIKRTDPYISPVFTSVEGFPPTLIICGTREVLLNDSVAFANKLKAGGVEHELHLWRGMFHDFPITGFVLRESKDAAALTAEFISARMS